MQNKGTSTSLRGFLRFAFLFIRIIKNTLIFKKDSKRTFHLERYVNILFFFTFNKIFLNVNNIKNASIKNESFITRRNL